MKIIVNGVEHDLSDRSYVVVFTVDDGQAEMYGNGTTLNIAQLLEAACRGVSEDPQ